MDLSDQKNYQIDDTLQLDKSSAINNEIKVALEQQDKNNQNKEYIIVLKKFVVSLLQNLEQNENKNELLEKFHNIVYYFENIEKRDQKLDIFRYFLQNKRINNHTIQKDIQQVIKHEEQIPILRQLLEYSVNINKELMIQVSTINEKNVNLVIELNKKQNKFQEITIQQQIQNMDENSMMIEINNIQFQENIQKLNMEREQTITKMKNLLQQFQQFQSNDQFYLNNKDEKEEFQNIINQLQQTINIIKNMEDSIEKYKKELEKDLVNQTDEVKNQTQELIMKLVKNRTCFNHIRIVFDYIIKMLKDFEAINEELQQKNNSLDQQVKSLQIKNNQFEKQMEYLINELNEQFNQERKLIIDQGNKLNNQQIDRLDIQSLNNNLDKYYELYNGFIDQIRVGVDNMICKNLQFLLIWNQNLNNNENRQLIESTKSFITSLEESNKNIKIDVMEQQLKKSMILFEQIFSRFNSNTIVNQYNYQNLQCLLKILQSISSYKEEIDIHKQIIENQDKIN